MVNLKNEENGYVCCDTMRSNRFLLFGILLTICIMGLIPSTSATSTQWFPDDGTTVEYTVTYYFTFKSGFNTECSEFILYNDSGTTFYAVPTVLRTYFPSVVWPGTIIISDTELRIQHTYSNYSATYLKKTVNIIWDGGSIAGNGKTFFLVLFEYVTADNIFQIHTSNTNILRDSFPGFAGVFFLHDYIDASAGILEPTPYLISNILITPNNIVARWELAPYGTNANLTYVADGTGKVLSFGYSVQSSQIVAANLICASYGFSVIDSSGGIPGFPLSWTILTLFGGIFIIMYLGKGIRNKRYL